MPVFQYKALDRDGKATQGVIEASGTGEAKDKLRQQGLMVKLIQPKKSGLGSYGLKGEALVSFTLQLSQLINAGLPLYESLLVLEEQYRGEKPHALILGLSDKVKSGTSLSAAMADYPQSFDTLYRSMIAAGEASGSLEIALDGLTELLNKQSKLKKQLNSALIYPSVLAVFCLGLMHLLLTVVVPNIRGIFGERELNAYTQFVLNLSSFYQSYAWLIGLAAIGGAVGLWYYVRQPAGRLMVEKVLLKLPLVKTLMIRSSLARFCRTMCTLQKGGVSLIDSLRHARGVMGVHQLRHCMELAESKIIEGRSLSQELKRFPVIPVLMPRMIAVGEETGQMTTIWTKVAEIYEGEVEKLVSRTLTLIQPIILIVMAGLILFIMLAILLPLSDISALDM